jgi:TonB family protein
MRRTLVRSRLAGKKTVVAFGLSICCLFAWSGIARDLRSKSSEEQRVTSHSGIIAVDVNMKSGQVLRVGMLKSTGQPVLDKAAMDAFRTTRFRHGVPPGTFSRPVAVPASLGAGVEVRRLEIPIRYTLRPSE